jgi:hypothetical protein
VQGCQFYLSTDWAVVAGEFEAEYSWRGAAEAEASARQQSRCESPREAAIQASLPLPLAGRELKRSTRSQCGRDRCKKEEKDGAQSQIQPSIHSNYSRVRTLLTVPSQSPSKYVAWCSGLCARPSRMASAAMSCVSESEASCGVS